MFDQGLFAPTIFPHNTVANKQDIMQCKVAFLCKHEIVVKYLIQNFHFDLYFSNFLPFRLRVIIEPAVFYPFESINR